MNPTNFPDNMLRKRSEAADRKIEHELMTPDALLRKLDRRPGDSKRERARIAKRIEMDKALKAAAKKEEKKSDK